MKIIKLLYTKYFISLSICLITCLVIFFVFSLLGNLDEEYLFDIIIKISLLNSVQILSYVPAFIFLTSVILLTIFLRSKNEMVIIKSYVNIKLLVIFFIPIVIIFTILEINKKELSSLIDSTKTSLINDRSEINTKIFINKNNNFKSYIFLKNINPNDTSKAEYRSFDIFNKKIQLAQFSDKLIFLNNTLSTNNYTQYKDNIIKNFNIFKSYDFKANSFIGNLTGNITGNANSFINNNFVVKDLSEKNKFNFDFKIINNLIFFTLFFCFIFLTFLNKELVSTKIELKKPVFICLLILIYSFLIFNNSLSIYRQEFEFLASFIACLFFFKAYINE